MNDFRICVPSTDQNGLESRIGKSFGASEYLTIVDIEKRKIKEVQSIKNLLYTHSSPVTEFPKLMDSLQIDILIVERAGDACMELLHLSKVKAVVEKTGPVAEAVRSYL